MIVSKLFFVNILIVCVVLCCFLLVFESKEISHAFLSILSELKFPSGNDSSHLGEMVVLQFIFCLEVSFGNAVVAVGELLLEIHIFFLRVVCIRDVGIYLIAYSVSPLCF